MELTKASTKGQVVIPQEIRERLKIKPGDTLQVEQVGELILLKKVALKPLAEEFGARQKRGGGR